MCRQINAFFRECFNVNDECCKKEQLLAPSTP